MIEPLKVVDGLALGEEYRKLLRPDAPVDGLATSPRLPRFFYEIESWQQALETKLTAHFTLAELMAVDCREAERLLHQFPHYVPCAISVLARYLEEFRARVEAPVMICVNGGYRSPAHRVGRRSSLHLWGAAADIYRIGDNWLDNVKTIERYGHMAQAIGQEVFVKPYGHGEGESDDHLHLDLGYLYSVPRSLVRN